MTITPYYDDIDEDIDEDIMEVIKEFTPKIKKSLFNTSYQSREDLEQEIKLKIIEKMRTIHFEDPPSFWSLVKMDIKDEF